jgi:dephospho-CoA kinase
MIIIGLTGSIGMGKSTVAKILSGYGLPIHNADQVVHVLLGDGGAAVAKVAKLFPAALRKNGIDRKILGQIVFGNKAKLRALETIIHPLVHEHERAFLAAAKRQKVPAVVLEIPLLFETKADKRCDIVFCVSAPKSIQMARVMKRKGMTTVKFKAIAALQMSDTDKRKRADYVIGTGVSLATTKKQIRTILADILGN